MATPNATSDMAAFFDFGEAALPEVPLESQHIPSLDETGQGPFEEGILPELPQNDSTEFNTDFSTHIPRYLKPAHPCDYCRSRSLECFIYNSDGSKRITCSPCNALFRACSFDNPKRTNALNRKTALDTLDVVNENEQQCTGGLTGIKQMRSLGHVGPIEDDEDRPNAGPKKGAAAARFPRAATKILKDWMIAHLDNPYPTEEEKEILKQQTGLNLGQISNWMANTRRRQKARPKRSASPSIRPSTRAINIPPGKTWDTMNPFDRWKHSPPENEPASMVAIAHAVETFDLPETASLSSSYHKDASNNSTGSFSVFRAPSITSLETGLTNMSSGSLNSAYSHGSRHSLGSMNSLRSKERRRRRRVPTRAPRADMNEGPRLFQCTFCTDRFKSKYDWSRHEKSLHLSLEKWLCAPLGEVIADKASGKSQCVYCDTLDPTPDHLATHNHKGCCEKGIESRTFYRKDHLRQHLRLMHGCKMTASMDSWKSEAQHIKSRCGFCKQEFENWQDRVDHLAKEFRNGADMKDWKGCRGLDPHVAIHVTNAMPPYLIANESKSPFPFSASNSASLKLSMPKDTPGQDLEYTIPSQSPSSQQSKTLRSFGSTVPFSPNLPSEPAPVHAHPDATCWEVLTLRLGQVARQHIDQHGADSVTDDMLQAEARRILYGDPDDLWNQTAADNPEWLNLFKKAHGISTKGYSTNITTQHEVFEDLGLRNNSVVDPSFNMNHFDCENLNADDPHRAMGFACSLAGTTRFVELDALFSSGQQSPSSVPRHSGSGSVSPTSQTAMSMLPITQAGGLDVPITEIACTGPGGPCFGESGFLGFSTRKPGQPLDCLWANVGSDSIMEQACSKSGDPIFECPTVGLRSFNPINEQECTMIGEMEMPTLTEQVCSKSGDMTSPDFNFPSWDQLPVDFQNPTTSAEFNSTIPISTTDVDMSILGPSAGNGMTWDDHEMNFEMDLDMDLDMNLNMMGKC